MYEEVVMLGAKMIKLNLKLVKEVCRENYSEAPCRECIMKS